MSTAELKAKLLELLKVDEEFRLAVAGLIGLGDVLRRLEEHDKKFNDIIERLKEHDKKFYEVLERLKEHDKKFCEILERLEEHDRKFEELLRRLEEHDRKFKEVIERLEEHDRKFKEVLERLDRHEEELIRLREDMNKGFRRHDEELARLREDMQKGFERHDRELAKLREDMNKGFERHDRELARLREDMQKGFELLRRHINALGARWGLMAEETFREGLKGILEEELGLKVERWTGYDEEGTVYGHPSPVEIDVAIKDGKLILVEISSHVRASDVATFRRKADFYTMKTGRAPDRLLMVTPFVEEKVLAMAVKLGITIYTKV